jgi:hypothetical protein
MKQLPRVGTLKSRQVRCDENGRPLTTQRDPALRSRVLAAYAYLCSTGEEGAQLVAVHQELAERLDAVVAAARGGRRS